MTDGGPGWDAGRPGSRDLATLDDTLELAREALAAGRPDEAGPAIAIVLDEVPPDVDRPERQRRRIRALGLLSIITFEEEGLERALSHLDEALSIATSIGDGELVGRVWSERAAALGRSGRLAESLAALDEAARDLDALSGRTRTIVLMNRGTARAGVGDLVGAIADLEAAARSAEEHGLGIERFMATHNLGYYHHLRGDEPAALRAMEEADALDVDVSRGISLLDRGRVLLEAGLADEAVEVLTRAATVCAADGQRQAEAEAAYERARALLLKGRTDDALALVRTAAARFDDLSSVAWLARCRVTELRLALHLHRRGTIGAAGTPGLAPPALATAGRALVDEVATIGGLAGRTARALAAEALALSGDVTGGRALLADLLGPTPPEPAPLLTVRLDEHRALATVASAAGDDEAAGAVLVAAARDLARAALSATTLDLRTARVAHAIPLAAADLARALPTGPLATLEAVERWRAPSSRLPPVRPAADPRVTELLATRRRLREELRDATTPPPDAWEELADLERRIAEARRGATAIPGDGSPAADLSGDPVGPVEPGSLLAALAADDRDLLVTAASATDVVAVDVRDGVPSLRTIGPTAELSALARRIRTDLVQLPRATGPLGQAIRSSLQAGAAALGELLLGRDGRARDGRLLVVAHGDLVGLPWGLLAPGRPTVDAASASAWVRARGDVSSAGPRTTRPVDVRVLRGPGLPAAAEEAAAVATAWGTVPPSGHATASELAAALADADVVHVVAHGRHHRQQPLFSSLSVGDGPCSLYDLETSGVGAEVVVLASCDAASATIRPGDEPLGLAAGLLALGARCVVAPVSPVPDHLLPPVMARLHAGLVAGLPVDEALIAAADRDPLAAAAFVVSGVAA